MEYMHPSDRIIFMNKFYALPVEERTKELCMKAISINPFSVLKLESRDMTRKELLLEAAKVEGDIISWLPEKDLNPKIIKAAVNNYGPVLEFVPGRFITGQLCMDAVKQDGKSLMFVPRIFVTEKMCKEALKNVKIKEIDKVLAKIPYSDISLKVLKSLNLKDTEKDVKELYHSGIHPEAYNPDIFRYLIDKDPSIIKEFKDYHLDDYICLYAVKKNGTVLQHIPEDLINEDLCRAAIESDINSIRFIPENLKTDELLLYAVGQDPFIIEQLDGKHLTRELCEQAIKTDGIIGNIPYPDLCMKMWDNLINAFDCLDMLEKMHPKGWDEKFAEKVINTWGIYLEYVPENLITEKLCFDAVRNDGFALEFVPEKYLSKEMCLKAIDNTPAAIKFMPEDFHNEQSYKYLIERDAHNLIGIPQDFITHEMCKIALENTYFKDNNDTSLIMHINQPDIMLRVLESKKDIKGLEFSLICSCPKAFDDKVLKHIIEHRPELFSSVPLKYLKDSVWEKAIGENPGVLKNVNPKNVTPEMCLIAVKGDPEMKKHVPSSISSANNIYTFCMDIEKKYNLNLSVKDAKDLFEGKPLKIDRINTEKGLLNNQVIKKEPIGPNISIMPIVPVKKASVSKKENISGNRRKSGVKPKF